MELASSASEALAVTEESIGSGKLYSAHDRASLPLARRSSSRSASPKRPARATGSCSAATSCWSSWARRSARATTRASARGRLWPACRCKKTTTGWGRDAAPNAISRASGRRGLLGRRAAGERRGARRHCPGKACGRCSRCSTTPTSRSPGGRCSSSTGTATTSSAAAAARRPRQNARSACASAPPASFRPTRGWRRR